MHVKEQGDGEATPTPGEVHLLDRASGATDMRDGLSTAMPSFPATTTWKTRAWHGTYGYRHSSRYLLSGPLFHLPPKDRGFGRQASLIPYP